MNRNRLDDDLGLVTEWQLSERKGSLILRMVSAFLAVLLTAAVEAVTIGRATHERLAGPLNENTSLWLLISVSMFSIFVWWGVGLHWYARPRRTKVALALYTLMLAVFAVSLWPGESARARELWEGSGSSAAPFAVAAETAPASGVPLWFQLAIVMLWATVFTASGVAFCWSKHQLARTLRLWNVDGALVAKQQQVVQAGDATAQVERLTASVAYLESRDTLVQLGRYCYRQALAQHIQSARARLAACERKAGDVSGTAAEQQAARDEAVTVRAWLEAFESETEAPARGRGMSALGPVVAAGLLALSLAVPAFAQSTQETCATASTLQIAVDVSVTSPAKDADFVRTLAPVIASTVKALPLCSWVDVVAFGDNRLQPQMQAVRIFNRTVPGQGATREAIMRGLQQWLMSLPARINAAPHPRSEIMGAIAEFAKNMNPRASYPNTLILLTDGLEASDQANCERKTPCRLPAAQFRFAPNAHVALWGAGAGQPASRAQDVERAWTRWLTAAGAASVDVRRIVLGAL